MKRRIVFVLACLGLVALGMIVEQGLDAQATHARRRVIKPTGAAANLPFSEGVLVGDTLYVAGHIGTDPKTGQAPADVNAEIKFLLDGIADTLMQGGTTFDDLVYVQVYCTDLSLYDKFNAAYAARFKQDFPSRMFVGTNALLRNGHFEMMAIAAKR